MGRKIPGRKHRGVRDPEKQRHERFQKIKDKINTPPTNPDEQHVPKSLQRLAELTSRIKSGEFKRKKSRPRPKEMFEQGSNETERQFLYRVNREVAMIKHEAAFEQKFGVEVRRNEEGEVEEVRKCPQDPIKAMMKEARKEKKKKKKGGDEEVLTKSQKRRRKLLEKKKNKGGEVDEFKQFQDKVKFGEQAHEPPTLTAPRRVKIGGEAPRPGKKDLLLKSMLDQSKVIDRTGKRKNLPNALRRQLDKQQKEIIDAYRQIKEQKREVLQ